MTHFYTYKFACLAGWTYVFFHPTTIIIYIKAQHENFFEYKGWVLYTYIYIYVLLILRYKDEMDPKLYQLHVLNRSPGQPKVQ